MIVARLLLVLLLVFDQVGSPLHEHHHDSGIDAYALQNRHAEVSVDAFHPDVSDPGRLVFHAVTALTSGTPVVLGPFVWDPPRLVNHFPLTLNAFVLKDVDSRPLPRSLNTIRLVHRSLPLDGRAPPLHA